MDRDDRERLRYLSKLGDMNAMWDWWKRMERQTGITSWRIGSLPDIGRLSDELYHESRKLDGDLGWLEEEFDIEGEDILLIYSPVADEWELIFGPYIRDEHPEDIEIYGLVRPGLEWEDCDELASRFIEAAWRAQVQGLRQIDIEEQQDG